MTKRSRARSPESIDFARVQRRNSNEFASTVWQWIRNRQILGAKFRREYPIPPYTVDFCCIEVLSSDKPLGITVHFLLRANQSEELRNIAGNGSVTVPEK